MRARVYRPARSAMQSGNARTKQWVLEFDTVDEAVAYATRNGIAYDVFEPHRPAAKAKSYADNFRFDRKIPWSH
jgi:hypothetical protein